VNTVEISDRNDRSRELPASAFETSKYTHCPARGAVTLPSLEGDGRPQPLRPTRDNG
jgi:hypothetical protein